MEAAPAAPADAQEAPVEVMVENTGAAVGEEQGPQTALEVADDAAAVAEKRLRAEDDAGDNEANAKRPRVEAEDVAAEAPGTSAAPSGAADEPAEAVDEAPGGGGDVGDGKEGEEGKPGYIKVGRKRKVAVFISYLGAGYSGMQRNPGCKTIEGELERAFRDAGAIAQWHYGDPKKIGWMRAARTDRGVSALGQASAIMLYSYVVSLKMIVEPEGVVERINEHLPEQIRVHGYKRVTNSFDARLMCDCRRYEYVLPTFAFASARKTDALVATPAPEAPPAAAAALDDRVQEASMAEPSADHATDGAVNGSAKPQTVLDGDVPFKFNKSMREFVSKILSRFVGTHIFHNFTAKKPASDPSCQRYIKSFTISELFVVDGMELVRLTVVGQSFLLHQIRKMVGMVVAVVRGHATEETVEAALSRKQYVNVPMAPELGLFLVECIYGNYNRKFAHLHGELTLRAWADAVEEFKVAKVYPHIVSTERSEHTAELWLKSLSEKNYRDSGGASAASENGARKLDTGNVSD
eukprot:jgi/Chlat1/9105/Chrsp97S08383